jgi:type II secretory pathway component GspD/PulD (secretin)
MLRKFIWTIFFTLLVCYLSVDAYADQNPPASADSRLKESLASQPAPSSEIRTGTASIKKSSTTFVRKPQAYKGQVSLNFDDADINAVMQTVLGNLLKVNYLIDPRVKGNITFRSIAPVPYDEILPIMEVILRINGIAIVESSGIYRVIPISDIPKESGSVRFGRSPDGVDMSGKALIQVVQINYGSSTEISRVITPFISTNAVIIDVPKNNQIILVDTPANIKRLLSLVNIFDNEDIKKKSPQVYVYNVQNSKAKDMVMLLHQIFVGKHTSGDYLAQRMMEEQMQQQQQQQQQPQQDQPQPMQQTTNFSPAGSVVISEFTKIFFDELTNTIIILGTPEDYKVISDTIKTIDVVPRQVIIEGVVAQIILKDNMSTGLSWALNTNIRNLGVKIGVNTANLETANIPGKGFTVVGTDSTGVIHAVISALASDSKAKLLASPHILVSDNREARIQVGQSVPIVTSETIAQAGVPPQRTIQYKDIGIILKVKPRINDSGLVSMDITQEISAYTTEKLYTNEVQIILQKTEASTSLVVQDGQTIIIGGLIREDKKNSLTGIPFLSKIPIVGFLFGETTKDKDRTEIIILLTPHVIKNQKNAADATNRYVEKFTGKGVSQDIKKEDLIINLEPFEKTQDN